MNFSTQTAPEAAGQRLDQFLKDKLPQFSRGKIQRAVRQGACLLDGEAIQDSSYRLKAGQKILFVCEEEESPLKAEDGDIKIIWQDKNLLLCDKEPNLTVHPCPSCPENTLAQRLLSRFPELAKMGGERPGIVHRLDKDTSGLLLVALSEEARIRLSDAFAKREISKEYLALVAGLPEISGECDAPIGRHPELRTKMAVVSEAKGGKKAYSVWKRLWHSPDNKFSLISIQIHSGRTHQIRVHMAHLGHPLLGDRLYAPADIRELGPRQMLHAYRLELTHPFTQEKLCFFAPLPEDFFQTIINTTEKAQRIILTGNPGCGKSSLGRELEQRGLPRIDADAIIRRLYLESKDLRHWLTIRGFQNCINKQGALDKNVLLKLFEDRPDIKHDFEKFVHAMVRDEISNFWQKNQNCMAAVAEVPLFFEIGMEKIYSDLLTVGVHCNQELRYERLRRDRDWSDEKIATIESWQMPEAEKMARCDLVYDNMGTLEELALAAENLIEQVKIKRTAEREKLRTEIEKLTYKS